MLLRFCFVLLPLLVIAGCGPVMVLDRAGDGTPILIRSPQVSARDLKRLHAEHGVGTVLNLRGENPESVWFREEQSGVEAIGARWEHIRMSGHQPVPGEQLDAFLSLVEDQSAWPILMHCAGGVHRAGAMSAVYRMQYQGWTADEAIAEMERYGFDWGSDDRSALKAYLRGYEPVIRTRGVSAGQMEVPSTTNVHRR